MVESFSVVNRSATGALQHYLKHNRISLPSDYQTAAIQLVAQSIMDIEVSQIIDASLYERKESRRAFRNGYRKSFWQMQERDIPIRIPKLRRGSYYPSFVESQQVEQHVLHFVQDSYLNEIHFHAVDRLLADLMIFAGPSQIASLHEAMFDLIAEYRERLISALRVQLDLLPVEDRGQRRYLAVAIAADELIDHEMTDHVDDTFWQDFIRRIDKRSIRDVEYVAVGRVGHVVRLIHTRSPQMALAA